MASIRQSTFATAQRRSVLARNRNAIEALVAPMAAFAELPEATQTVKALARHLGRSTPTIYRRFGHRNPLGGAYVMALCALVAPARRATRWFATEGGELLERHDGGLVFLRGFGRAFLSPLLAYPALTLAAHRHGLAGVELRPSDLMALDEDSKGIDGAHDPATVRPVEYLPVLVDAATLLLERIGRPVRQAPELAQHLVTASFGCAEGNVNGATNRFLDRALPSLGVERTPPSDALDQAWLLTQLAERLALQGTQRELRDLYRLLHGAPLRHG
ncbi:MAG: hypothetical protein M0004_01890 [Actinomycetota bacterium]|nr:hypothetical protein [Actinomycetota bacterium]